MEIRTAQVIFAALVAATGGALCSNRLSQPPASHQTVKGVRSAMTTLTHQDLLAKERRLSSVGAPRTFLSDPHFEILSYAGTN